MMGGIARRDKKEDAEQTQREPRSKAKQQTWWYSINKTKLAFFSEVHVAKATVEGGRGAPNLANIGVGLIQRSTAAAPAAARAPAPALPAAGAGCLGDVAAA